MRSQRADTLADGYMIHHYFDKVRLWALSNGKSAGLVDEQVAALSAPNAGDTLMVEFTTDGTGHHFRVLINGAEDAVVSDAQKQQGNASINYAGVMVNGNTANGIDYFFAARTIDSAPPGVVTDLAVVSASASSISLRWKAPGEDDNIGTAKSYDLRYSTAPINDVNFGNATPADVVPTPATAGTMENATVSGLEIGTAYYFALKTAGCRRQHVGFVQCGLRHDRRRECGG